MFITISVLLGAMSLSDLRSFTVPLRLSLCLMACGAYISIQHFDLEAFGIKLAISLVLSGIAYLSYLKHNVVYIGGADILILSALLLAIPLKSWFSLCYMAILLAGLVGVLLKLCQYQSRYLPFVPFISGAFWLCHSLGLLTV